MITNLTIPRGRACWLILCVICLMVIGSPSSSSVAATRAQQGRVSTIEMGFESLPEGRRYRVGEMFCDSGVLVDMRSFIQLSGDPYDGSGLASNLVWWKYGNDRSLSTGEANFHFRVPGAAETVSLVFNGTPENIGINTEFGGKLTRVDSNAQLAGGMVLEGIAVHAEFYDAEQKNGVFTVTGTVYSITIGGRELALDSVTMRGDLAPEPCTPAARLLLVTQGNKAAEYNVSIIPGTSRGHPNQFNQWIVTVLDPTGQPLDAYGIWDPRLTLVHDIEGVHSKLIIESDLAYMFDIVLPFTDNYNGGIPAEVLLHDQELTLLADVDLSPAINRYCQEFAARTPACQAVGEGIRIKPISDLPESSFTSRPSATTKETVLANSERVAACLPPDSTSDQVLDPEALRTQLQQCGLFK